MCECERVGHSNGCRFDPHCKEKLEYENLNVTICAKNDIQAHLNVPTTPVACGGTGSSVKRYGNWCYRIPSTGLGRKTTNNSHTGSPLITALSK